MYPFRRGKIDWKIEKTGREMAQIITVLDRKHNIKNLSDIVGIPTHILKSVRH